MTILALGPFRLDTRHDLLFHGDEPVALGRRAVTLLRALVERPGALVSKETLIEAAWPGLTIEDSNLTVQIAALRRALGEIPGGDRWIETMPRRGYRFVAPVVAEGSPDALAPPQAEARSDLAPIAQAGAERRQITALFCELIGGSSRSDEDGLEELRATVDAFQRCVSAVVDRRDGFVFGYLGNTALILFGYPAAHEHDAERAVRTGIELCTAVETLKPGSGMQFRVGIATGMAIISDLGEGGALRDRQIIGAPPNLARQVLLWAPPNGVAIEPATRQLIGDLFDCRDLGTIDAPGHGKPTPVWHVLGESAVASRFEALRRAALTQVVGRDEEIGLLQRLWARARTGEGQIVLVSGEPGIGKSRLAAALVERLRAESYFQLRYFCSPYHQDSALHPFADQLGRASGFVRDDPPTSRRDKLEALLAGVLPDEDVASLTDLLALPASERRQLPNLSPQRAKERTFEALIRQLEGLARREPGLVIFEDAHWIDATSRELLDRIVERTLRLPVLLVVTFRPEFQPPWIGLSRVTMLALNRLDRRDRISLVAQVAGKALPATVIDQIADRTDGVPLFIEELTKSVLESGLLRAETDRYVLDGALPPFAIPTSLYASLLARLDRPASVRLAAQAGAAIGREFPYALLRAVSGLAEDELQGALARLAASGLVFQRGAPLEAVYSFKHALVQDVAYGTLLRGARRQLHARIALALEIHSPELMEHQSELFAQHYAEGGLVEKSIEAWAKAGRRSAARSALAEAAAHYQRALEQLALLPVTPERLRQELEFRSALGALLRFVKGQAAPETGEAYARTRELWEQLGSPLEFRHVPYGQSMYHVYRGELDLALRVGEELLQLSRRRNDAAGLVLGHSASGQSLLLAGRFAAAKPHLEELLALYDPIAHGALVHRAGSHPLMTQAFLGLALFCLGFPEQAIARSNAAVADARRLAHPTSLAVSLAIGALHLSLAGDYAALQPRADELTAVAIEQGLPFYHAWGTIYRGHAQVKGGNVGDGIALLRKGVAAYRATGSVMWLPHFISLLAAGNEIAGQIEEAATLLDEALRIVDATGERWFAAELNRHKGRLLQRQGQVGAAEDLYGKALRIAREQGAKLWELRAAASLAQLRRDQGRHAEARDLLGPVCSWFAEGFDTSDLNEAKAVLDSVQAAPTAMATHEATTIPPLRP